MDGAGAKVLHGSAGDRQRRRVHARLEQRDVKPDRLLMPQQLRADGTSPRRGKRLREGQRAGRERVVGVEKVDESVVVGGWEENGGW